MTLAMTDKPQETPAEAATRWLVLLQSDDVTAEEQREFAEWLAADQAHPLAYQDAKRFWGRLDRLSEQDVQAFNTLLSPSAAPAEEGNLAPRRRAGRFAARRRTALFAAAAVVAALCVVGIAETWHLGADYRTSTGEQRTVILSDGSTVQLNTGTALSVTMTADARRLTLHEGEAFFTVAPDRNRPFEVAAGAGTIRALGTAFNVRTDGRGATVTVTEHSVRVSASGHGAADVPEGRRLSYSPTGELGAVEAADPGYSLAWLRRRLIFENRPLAEVVAELNRYRRGWIVLRDPSLARLPVTAMFDVNKTDQALRTIEETLPVHTLALTDRLVLLSRKGTKGR